MAAILTMAIKDLRLLTRDKPALFFAVVFPVVYATFFGYLYSGFGTRARSAIRIAVLDEDQSARSTAFVERLRESPDIAVTRYDSVERAHEDVRLQRQTAYLRVMPGFGTALGRPFWGDPAKVEIAADPARFAETGLLEGLIMRKGFEEFQKSFSDPDTIGQSVDESLAQLRDSDSPDAPILTMFLTSLRTFVSSPVMQGGTDDAGASPMAQWRPFEVEMVSITRQRRGPTNSFAIAFPQAIVWGLMGCSAAFGIGLVVERREGTLTRLRIAPVSRLQILGGKALACFLSTTFVCLLLVTVAYFFFGVKPDSWPILALAIGACGVGFVGIMMLLSVLGRTEASAGGIGWAILLMLSMLGGAMVPTFVMPKWMQSVAVVSPVNWAIFSLEGAIWRGLTPADPDMLLRLALLVAIGVGGYLLGARLLSWSAQQ